jgi:hypothetical protein
LRRTGGVAAAGLRDVAIGEIDTILKPLNVGLRHRRALLSGDGRDQASDEHAEQEPAMK